MRSSRPLVAEFVGTALVLAAVVGSGIMGERLASGNVAVALLANTLATGAALVALIRLADVPGFWLGQVVGAFGATALFRWLVPALPAVAGIAWSYHTNSSERRSVGEGNHAYRHLQRRSRQLARTGRGAR